MDPIITASSVVSLLVSLFKHATERVGEKSADKVTDAATDALASLYQRVKERLTKDRTAAGVLARLESAPDSERAQGALEYVLAQVFTRDQAFAAMLGQLVNEVHASNAEKYTYVTDAGAVALGGDVRLQGHTVAGRDLTIGTPPPPMDSGR